MVAFCPSGHGYRVVLAVKPDTSIVPPAIQHTSPRQTIRQEVRQRRRALGRAQQRKAAEQLCARVLATPEFLRARRVAVYLANDGEIDPRLLIAQIWKMGKTCYLPVLEPLAEGKLWFVRYAPNTPMTRNRFGIPEPRLQGYANQKRHRSPPQYLDLVLLPLVAFDAQGNRMGMGGGFYDRTFAFSQRKQARKPVLMGLAHECQKLESLPVEAWDVPLQGIISDLKVYRRKKSPQY